MVLGYSIKKRLQATLLLFLLIFAGGGATVWYSLDLIRGYSLLGQKLQMASSHLHKSVLGLNAYRWSDDTGLSIRQTLKSMNDFENICVDLSASSGSQELSDALVNRILPRWKEVDGLVNRFLTLHRAGPGQEPPAVLLSRILSLSEDLGREMDWIKSTTLARMEQRQTYLLIGLGTFGALFLCLLYLAGLNLYRAVTHPLAALVHHVHLIAAGDLGRKLELQGYDEFRLLAKAFNDMAQNLSTTLVSKGFLDTVIGSMSEAVVLLGSDLTMESVNRATLEMLGYLEAELVGKPLDLIIETHEGRTPGGYLCFGGSFETHFKARDGRAVPVLFSATRVRDEGEDRDRVVCVATDVSLLKSTELELREKKDHLQRLAYHDSLTGLPNRLHFRDRLGRALALARRRGETAAVLFLDLDRFKKINDSLGHDFGDRVLMEASRRLLACLRQGDTVARLGGDEFMVLLEKVENPEQISLVAEKILFALQGVMNLDTQEIYTTASIGISLFPHDGQDEETLMKHADVAMYCAKAQGRNVYRFYNEEMNVRARELLALEGRLRKALEAEEFFLQYQPQVDLKHGQMVGMEALVRWMDPERGLISPGDFIPLAEENGLIVPLGDWVLREACRQVRLWMDQGLPPVRMAVNISARQFRQPRFVERVTAIFSEAGVDPKGFELEITESTLMEETNAAVAILKGLKKLGFQLAIDDFGTGFSSLGYLKAFPIDKLKIDRSFVRDVVFNANDAAIAVSVMSLARSMNLRVVAEGIETREQLKFLQSHGCEQGQGFLFSAALCAEEIPVAVDAGLDWPSWPTQPLRRVLGGLGSRMHLT